MPRVDGSKHIDAVFDRLKERLKERIKKKSPQTFVSTHECYGVMAEEFNELSVEMQSNDFENFALECEDIAIAAIWSLVSLKSGEMDW
jgi:methionine synthase II (cobalamin-independent)